MLSSTLQHQPSEVFPSLAAFLDALRAEGFTPKLAAGSTLESTWPQLSRPASSTWTEADASSFCYHSKRSPLSGNWGLVLRDAKLCPEPAANEIAVDFPDAALDFLLRKMIHPEWVGDQENFASEHATQSKVRIEAGVVVGPDSQLGEGVILEAGVRIGARVRIGKNTRIGAGSRIADDTVIGEECYFRGPVSIGGQGFGFLRYPKSPLPRHRVHVGSVLIGDRVQLGSFVAIDRGVFEDTVIGSLSATDNLVQIAHNCKLGKANILCGLVGLAGSTILGDYVTFGGFVVTKGHLKVGNHVQVGGWSGVYDDVPDGAQLRGIPARPIRRDLKIMAITEKLPELYEQLNGLLGARKTDSTP